MALAGDCRSWPSWCAAPVVVAQLPFSPQHDRCRHSVGPHTGIEKCRVLRLRRVHRRPRAAGHQPVHLGRRPVRRSDPVAGVVARRQRLAGGRDQPHRRERHPPARHRDLDLGLRVRPGDADPEPQPPAVRLPVAGGPAADDAGPAAAERGDARRGAPPRRSAHRRPRRRRPAPAAAPTPRSTIDHVDVWVDPRSASPCGSTSTARARPSSPPSSSTSRPPPRRQRHRLHPGPGRQRRATADLDIAAFINRLGLARSAAGALAGFARNAAAPGLGSIGVYGRGVTEFAAAPLFGRTAGSLRRQLSTTAGVDDERRRAIGRRSGR